jgi:hygromycin-B 7''-O-kinase
VNKGCSGGKILRLVEFTNEYVEQDWCFKDHIGCVLEGELEITFAGKTERFSAGDGIFISGGDKDRHKAKATGSCKIDAGGRGPVKLPVISDATDYGLHFRDDVWSQVAATICQRHRIPYARLRRSLDGENIIVFVDETFVVKIFAPFRENYLRETEALDFAQGKLGIKTPELVQAGDIEGWSYLVMTQLGGHASRDVWTSMERRDRREIISHLGVAMSELHTHTAPLQTALNRDWPRFIERQAQESVERQRSCGANAEWLESLPDYIADRQTLLPVDHRPVFLHGDIHAGNLLLAQVGGHWQIAGLIDFGDSLCGFQEYEFVAPGTLMVQGDRELQRAMLLAYGYSETQLDLDLRARLMLLTILYECSDLRKYALRIAPEAINLALEELERAIWTFATE